ncbi:stage III sporulation protein AG [uncultured Gemmiger sp.]|uniref:stage III sporulation protein AG n=1 Tax=uncultured Gemmiger sp. TaxID=1623490 RepID=UPI0025F43EA8|nr:stage III sporulation protein AG [uncultured Gemmiger sp.]
MMPQPLQNLLQKLKTEKRLTNLLIIAGIAGMALIALSEWLPESAATDPPADTTLAAEEYAREMETRLEDLIREVDGAGAARVMVTLAENGRTLYATDTETGLDGTERQEHLLLDSGQPPALVEATRPPQVQGVAVLCEGGDSTSVQIRVTEIVDVLTGVGASHITVDRLKPE